PRLKDVDCDYGVVYSEVRVFMRAMYQKAKLVHADLSEYNILYHRKHAYIVDVGQSVSREHPAADYFLERDVKNISIFFTKKGVEAPYDDLLRFVKGTVPGE
ncbi:MAG: RIO1 family regulatory kinase/ATPase, partial [Thermoplasmataceae archaeon]